MTKFSEPQKPIPQKKAEKLDYSAYYQKEKTKKELAALRQKQELTDLQQKVENTLAPEEREKMKRNQFESFFTGLLKLDKNSKVVKFLVGITSWFADKLGAGGKALSDEEVFGRLDEAKKEAIESGIVAHKGSGEKPNSKEGIAESLKNGETEIEFDVRLVGSELYLKHDPMETGDNMSKLSRFKDVLPLFQQNPSARMFIDIKGGRATARSIMKAIRDADKNPAFSEAPLEKRAFFVGFNPETLATVREEMPNAPCLFCYIPTGGYPAVEQSIVRRIESRQITKGQLTKVLETVDFLGGGKTRYAANFKHGSLHINGKNPYGMARPEQLHTYSTLPPDSILQMVRSSGGALTVPWDLVKSFSRFFQEAQAAGVKVAVYGFENPKGIESRIDRHNSDVKRAIAMGASLIITDHANYWAK
ncbi:hypothetical protein JW752_04445 [Candidatus Peregrinibacteria bacterium]|nr:hypothetical protein [Candidatus Peregrinibacteria bacterium]